MKERFCINFNASFMAENPEDKLKAIKEAGFPTVHFSCECDDKEVYEKGLIGFCELSRRIGLEPVNFHPSYMSNNLLWLDAPEKEDVMARLKYQVELIGKLGMQSIIVHPTSGLANLYISPVGLDSFSRLAEIGEKNGVTICIENLRTHKHLDYILNNIDSPRVGFCHDTGHEFAYNKGMDFALRYKGRMAFTHIHDNDAVRDLHMIPGEGILDWKHLAETYSEAGYDGPLSLEINFKQYDDFEGAVRKAYLALVNIFGE